MEGGSESRCGQLGETKGAPQRLLKKTKGFYIYEKKNEYHR